MDETGGFTRSWRRKWSNPIFRNLRDAAIWAWMTDMAAWRPTSTRFADRLVSLSRGQLVTSERFIAKGFCCDRQITRRLFDSLEAAQMITRQQTHGGTIVTICNYDQYQNLIDGTNPQENPRPTHAQPTPNPNKKEEKEVKKEKSIYRDDPEFIEWYAIYPLKKDPVPAAKAYHSARKSTSAAILLAGAQRYRRECAEKEKRFIKHPATYLNARSWENEPEEQANGHVNGLSKQITPDGPAPTLSPNWEQNLEH